MLSLINEVLDVARIEAGRLSLSPEPVHLPEVIQEALDLVRPLAQERNITIGGLSGECDFYVKADRQRLRQVLLNLLANGVKYNVDGGRIDGLRRIAGERIDPDRRFGYGSWHLRHRSERSCSGLSNGSRESRWQWREQVSAWR